jgi:hypothetical protein
MNTQENTPVPDIDPVEYTAAGLKKEHTAAKKVLASLVSGLKHIFRVLGDSFRIKDDTSGHIRMLSNDTTDVLSIRLDRHDCYDPASLTMFLSEEICDHSVKLIAYLAIDEDKVWQAPNIAQEETDSMSQNNK